LDYDRLVRATLVVAAGLFASCGFEHGVYEVRDDAAPIDTATPTIDAKPDAPLDGRVCPNAPPGCTRFSCEASTSCYYVCGNATAGSKKNWSAARDACAQIGGSTPACVATINDATEQSCMVQQAMPSFPMSNWIWIGYRQPANTAEPLAGWDWECGASTFTHAPWGTGAEPSETGEEDCAALSTGGTWFDTNCLDSGRYLCEL
jgi:hypothetical protein